MHNSSTNPNKPSNVRRAIDLLSMVAAGVFTFLVTPFAYGVSIDAIRGFAAEHYSWTVGVGPLWWLTVVSIIGISAMLVANLLTTRNWLSGLTSKRF